MAMPDRVSARLFVPPGNSGSPRPLVVMLHGCRQTPEDFARGTRVEALAAEKGCAVLWPAQSARANRNRCWNWFKPGHQSAGAGEPAAIAAAVRDAIDRHGLDPARVYVAGLSAGGAMAVILGTTYPDLFTAVGVHSGLAYRAAHSLPSAVLAMKGAASGVFFQSPGSPQLTRPTIILHGDADEVVHPRNGEALLAQWLAAAWSVAQGARLREERGADGRRYCRRVVEDASGRALVEHWAIEGLAHAWSGGDRKGSFTDPVGPDASREMLRFFLAHAK
jgi:poly(hydroxyalkanoate) depolymerase family esterase